MHRDWLPGNAGVPHLLALGWVEAGQVALGGHQCAVDVRRSDVDVLLVVF